MNTFKKLIVVATLSSGFVFSSQAAELKAGDNSIYTQLCMSAASGSRVALYNSIKASGHSTKFVNESVQCNTKDIIAFVKQYGKNSEAIANMLDRRGTKVSITDLAMLARQYK